MLALYYCWFNTMFAVCAELAQKTQNVISSSKRSMCELNLKKFPDCVQETQLHENGMDARTDNQKT